ncbi:hypothetical protein M419DRAFT_131662 [Trichoderma reesei RUT C-30]|uniref:Secreted protein n=1 Tax=Hypocrea jecorina (strain ATCC 56765 / BCRC 32924 / NRRL 11460 / Rut C-30) TaxID=1344414 RepID=A0A024S7R5_HYPJR|nr:hypothetical protein M419DRAFT_131662 [Trichoderma reesei RUT C-30]
MTAVRRRSTRLLPCICIFFLTQPVSSPSFKRTAVGWDSTSLRLISLGTAFLSRISSDALRVWKRASRLSIPLIR